MGAQFLNLMAEHPVLELRMASSSTRAGAPIAEVAEKWEGRPETFRSLKPEEVGRVEAEVWVLAVPNGAARPWVEAIQRAHPDAVILDVGADYRFDPAWTYGLPELNREALRAADRISNPGCYATAAQLGLAPLAGEFAGPPVIFGISGHSGAGRTPSERNDPTRLEENLIPYALSDHLHEREIGHHLGQPVRFHPHVAAFFRGISLTLALELKEAATEGSLLDRYRAFFESEPFVGVQAEIPEIRQVRQSVHTLVGGFTVDVRDPRRAVLVVVLDNLLKGASSQAIQNLNLSLGLDESQGIEP